MGADGEAEGQKRGVGAVVERVDRFQQRRSWVAFPFAVVKKFGDDQAGNLAALIAYYGFFSFFPLLLVLVTILGLVLSGNPQLQQDILDTALAQFPVVGDQIQSPEALSGSYVALAVGIATALWAGLGVMQAAQKAMNDVWDVPRKERPNFIKSRLRGLIMLALLGTIVLLSAGLAGVGSAVGTFSFPLGLVILIGSLALNLGLFLLAFRILTERDLTWGDVFPGAALAAFLWWVLQAVGSYLVGTQIRNASDTYGTFAVVIGLLVWISIGAQMTLFCAEVNVVRKGRLWPRSVNLEPPLTAGDEHVLRRGAKVEERAPIEDVGVTFDPGTAPSSGGRSPVAHAPTASPVDAASAGTGGHASLSGNPGPEVAGRGGSKKRARFGRSIAVGAGAAIALGLALRARQRRTGGRSAL